MVGETSFQPLALSRRGGPQRQLGSLAPGAEMLTRRRVAVDTQATFTLTFYQRSAALHRTRGKFYPSSGINKTTALEVLNFIAVAIAFEQLESLLRSSATNWRVRHITHCRVVIFARQNVDRPGDPGLGDDTTASACYYLPVCSHLCYEIAERYQAC